MVTPPDYEDPPISVFPKLPYPCFRSGRLVIRENVYGILKRLRFFVAYIENERKTRVLEPGQVRILDLGCGTGVNVTIPLSGLGCPAVGIDPDPKSILRARELSSDIGNLKFLCNRLEDCVFPEPFHVVVCSEVLEHVAAPARLLAQIATNLCDGGLLLLSVPNGLGYFEIESLLWRLIVRNTKLTQILYSMEYHFWQRVGSARLLTRRSEEYEPDRYRLTQSTLSTDDRHLQSFTLSRISDLLIQAGFTIIEWRSTTLLAGNLIGLLTRELDHILRWNSEIVDKLPWFAASGWLIAARARNPDRSSVHSADLETDQLEI